jgi:DNA-binding transcriptional LysR family regulator
MSLLNPQLDAFMMVAECKTVHGAAQRLHITQTGITQRIKALEQRLQAALFTRTRRGMLLTSEGEALLRYCQTVRQLANETLANIAGAGTAVETHITICGPSSIMHARVIPECIKIIKQYPHLQMQFEVADVEERDKLLRIGACQFAILQKEHLLLEMDYKHLQPEKYVLVCSAKWQKRKLKDILQCEHIIDFNPADKMTFDYLKKFNLFEYARIERHFVNRPESMALLLAEGCGYGVLTKEFAQPYLEQKKLILLNAGKVYENKMVLVWYKRPQLKDYFAAVINNIK